MGSFDGFLWYLLESNVLVEHDGMFDCDLNERVGLWERAKT